MAILRQESEGAQMRRLRALIGAIPRAFKDHRRPDAKRYRDYCLNLQAQWGPLPAVALPMLREAGRAVVELERRGDVSISVAGIVSSHKRCF
jgi:hypothetical protein